MGMNLITDSGCLNRPCLQPCQLWGQPAFIWLLINAAAPEKLHCLKQEAGRNLILLLPDQGRGSGMRGELCGRPASAVSLSPHWKETKSCQILHSVGKRLQNSKLFQKLNSQILRKCHCLYHKLSPCVSLTTKSTMKTSLFRLKLPQSRKTLDSK